jgi:predicted RNA-binding Zn-ribbon protein involved in translation (DUF1610 family)
VKHLVKDPNTGIVVQANMKRRAVRIHHPTLRNCIFTVAEPARTYETPFPCPMCGISHVYKTHHLVLDANGDTVVSQEILQLFEEGGVVKQAKATKEVIPRPVVIGLPLLDESAQVAHPQNGYAPRQGSATPWQPPDVISQEQGPVKLNGVVQQKDKEA